MVGVPSATAADQLTLDWSVADRLNGRPNIDETAPLRPLRVHLNRDGSCPRAPAFELDGQSVTASPTRGCGFDLAPTLPGDHKLEMTAVGEHATADLKLRDYLVVSVGDSVASGEGNPDGPGPLWLETRCHRSLQSGAAQAALAVERGDRHSVITFVPLGCSGATIHKGLLNEYAGIQRNARQGALRAQLDVVAKLGRPIDALLLRPRHPLSRADRAQGADLLPGPARHGDRDARAREVHHRLHRPNPRLLTTRMSAEDFFEGLRALGYEVQRTGEEAPGGAIIEYEIPLERFIGQHIRLAFFPSGDWPLTCPSGPYVSPHLLVLNPDAGPGHPNGAVHPAPQLGPDWQYWSRPFPGWSGNGTVAQYMAHIRHLLATA
jgi:hypothetical protein